MYEHVNAAMLSSTAATGGNVFRFVLSCVQLSNEYSLSNHLFCTPYYFYCHSSNRFARSTSLALLSPLYPTSTPTPTLTSILTPASRSQSECSKRSYQSKRDTRRRKERADNAPNKTLSIEKMYSTIVERWATSVPVDSRGLRIVFLWELKIPRARNSSGNPVAHGREIVFVTKAKVYMEVATIALSV